MPQGLRLHAIMPAFATLQLLAGAPTAAAAEIAAAITAQTSSTQAATLEQRLRRLEDEKAIANLLLEYGRTLDARDFAAYAALFAADGEWKGALGSFKGPKAIQAEMERIFAGAKDIPKGQNFHAMSNFVIDVQGDRATAKSVFVFYQMEGNRPNATVAGRYEDILVRVNGAWKFQQRNALPPG
jgi:uncharacterized protein (TIGR02246 family)